MKAPRDKIRIRGSDTVDSIESVKAPQRLSDNAVLCLARLIGRQMAREQFEHARHLETKAPRQNSRGESS